MDISARLARLETQNRRLKWAQIGSFLVIGLLLVAGSSVGDSDNKSDGTVMVLKNGEGNVAASIWTQSIDKGEGPGVGDGLNFSDADGKVRARLSWNGLRTTFTLFSGKGGIIQALPIN
ncbi:hypothetical protein Pan216_32140 [Planctomycetes bacterium Pan216]|uniref:Uncharacterized protein n=1 Tax=Kolteria novifilia TaxID=2527975 RepID=A0A518B5U2_9BACT|nr:hypothetical protein Pan216_32140 [Planctomycetes bacterium Pan216]